VRTLQVHFSNRQQPDQPLKPGVQRIVRHATGQVGLGDDRVGPLLLAQFCVDQRGVWLQVASGTRGIHVNGRPVRRMALLRAGDAVYADGAEMLLRGECEPVTHPPAPQAASDEDMRVLLRGVGGRYHGRCFTLDQPRTIGGDPHSDILIDEPAFADSHARLERHGEKVLLRDLGSAEGTQVNGVTVRHCWLQAGDQLVFEGNHRFVLEVPLNPRIPASHFPQSEERETAEPADASMPERRPRRWPWLLLSALLLGAAISALLLFGAR
jgi:hypothetical protein